MCGAERALLYRLAVETGLRSNELRSLTRSSFKFGKRLATVTVEAKSSKRRRQDELPIRPATAELVRAHVAAKHPGAAAFTMPRADDMAELLRRDLRAARAAWLKEATTAEDLAERERSTFLAERDDAGGVVDFHALRHTFCTLLARSGVHPRVMQAMARHSDPKLTLSRYTHVETAEQAAALDLLPDLSTPEAAQARATGTDGGAVGDRLLTAEPRNDDGRGADSVLAFCLAFSDAKQCAEVQSDALDDEARVVELNRTNHRAGASFPAISETQTLVPPIGIEPTTYGLGNRCSIH